MKANGFLEKHAVFTVDELDEFLEGQARDVTKSRNNYLHYHHAQGRVIRLRRGLYATVPAGVDPDTYPVDPYLVASKMTGDAVLGYHTALEIHGYAHSIFNQFFFLTKKWVQPFRFQSYEIKAAAVPKKLVEKGEEFFGVEERDRLESKVRVTSIERTVVDVLDRPDLAGGWEEVWKSLEPISYLGTEKVFQYLQLLENATTASKVGFFLESHRESLMVDDAFLDELESLCPEQPHYLSRRQRKNATLIKRWNLLVPDEILHRSWEEPQ